MQSRLPNNTPIQYCFTAVQFHFDIDRLFNESSNTNTTQQQSLLNRELDMLLDALLYLVILVLKILNSVMFLLQNLLVLCFHIIREYYAVKPH